MYIYIILMTHDTNLEVPQSRTSSGRSFDGLRGERRREGSFRPEIHGFDHPMMELSCKKNNLNQSNDCGKPWKTKRYHLSWWLQAIPKIDESKRHAVPSGCSSGLTQYLYKIFLEPSQDIYGITSHFMMSPHGLNTWHHYDTTLRIPR